MNRNRIIIIALLVIILGGGIYWIISSQTSRDKKLTFVFFDYKINNEQTNKLLDELISLVNEQSEFNITFVYRPGKIKNINISHIDEFASEDDIKELLKDTLKKYINSSYFTKLSNEEANLQVNNFIDEYNTIDDNFINQVYLVGSFPNCYKKKSDVNPALKALKNKLADSLDNDNIVCWMLESNDNEVEQGILQLLKSKINENFINKQINVPVRHCDGEVVASKIKYQNSIIEFSVFSELDTNRQKKIIKKAKDIFASSKNIKVGYHNSEKSITRLYINQQIIGFENDLSNFLSEAKNVNFNRYKFIFKDTFDKYKYDSKDTVLFFLAGEKPERIKRLYQFRRWNRRRNQKVFLDFKPESFQNVLKNVFQSIFSYEVIK